jgi:hypothetical protein
MSNLLDFVWSRGKAKGATAWALWKQAWSSDGCASMSATGKLAETENGSP